MALANCKIEYPKMGVCKVQDAEGRVDAGRRNGLFPSVNDAVQAGKDIIRELGLFNRHDGTIGRFWHGRPPISGVGPEGHGDRGLRQAGPRS